MKSTTRKALFLEKSARRISAYHRLLESLHKNRTFFLIIQGAFPRNAYRNCAPSNALELGWIFWWTWNKHPLLRKRTIRIKTFAQRVLAVLNKT